MSVCLVSCFICCYAECHCAKCSNVECCPAECRYAECHGAKCWVQNALNYKRYKAPISRCYSKGSKMTNADQNGAKNASKTKI